MSLQATDLHRSFPGHGGQVQALRGVSLSVASGRSLAVVGPSGSGKSTLLGLLAGLDRPDRGQVVVDGEDLATLPERRLARLRGQRIGVVFQSYRLVPTLDALENVALPLELAGRADAHDLARIWLDRVGLAARADHLPARLSGGEQQRVALARALAPAPALVLADEPTGNLDSATGSHCADLLFALCRDAGSALVVVTHDPALAARADAILRLRDGLAEGP
ncbi:MAG: ABC transporter ATP-binding protein [Planctomycetes bacterium]|nr:ABC transporter ATP-binding protein [Planctomycetota bacterium]